MFVCLCVCVCVCVDVFIEICSVLCVYMCMLCWVKRESCRGNEGAFYSYLKQASGEAVGQVAGKMGTGS